MNEHTLKRIKFDPAKGRVEYLDPPCPVTVRLGSGSTKHTKVHLGIQLSRPYPVPDPGSISRLVTRRGPRQGRAGTELHKQGIDPGQKNFVELGEYRTSPTFEKAVESYLDWARANKKSWREDERMLRNEFVPHLGRAKIGDVRRKQVVALLDDKVKTAPVQANRLLAVIRKMFNFCVEREILDATPLVQIKKVAKENATGAHPQSAGIGVVSAPASGCLAQPEDALCSFAESDDGAALRAHCGHAPGRL